MRGVVFWDKPAPTGGGVGWRDRVRVGFPDSVGVGFPDSVGVGFPNPGQDCQIAGALGAKTAPLRWMGLKSEFGQETGQDRGFIERILRGF